MAEAENLFSESWHLVGPLRIMLRPDLQVKRQLFRGEPWWVVCDGMNQQFFRLRPAAYRFLGRLDGRRTVEDIWKDGVAREPEDTPGQQEIVQLIAQLAEASLIQSERAGDSLRQFAQRQKRQRQQFRQQALNFLFLRIPLLDPDGLLTRLLPVWRVLLSRAGAVAWSVAVLFGLKLAFEHWDELRDHGQGVLAPANLGWLYLASIGLKLWHELGHGAICKRFGGEVRTFGVMLMVFLPLPYVDATASHGFRERYARVLTGAGGMIFELFAAAVAMVVWVYTAPGIVNQVAYNIIFLASVSTLVFNLNPLLRFDGYFILCDLIEMPNLGQRANRQLTFLLERYAFGLPQLTAVGATPREVTWLASFGVASALYRVFVLWTVILFLGDRFFGLGLVLAAFGVLMWGVVPLGRFGRYLLTDGRLEMRRPRVLAVSGFALAALLLLLGVVPMPNRFQMPGVVRADPATAVVSASDGVIAELFVQPGATVAAGEPLLRLENPNLESRRIALVASVEESEARRRYARESLPAQLAALDRRWEAVRGQLAEVERQQAGLTVRAPHAGRWAAGGVDYPRGLFVPRGAGLGEIVGEGRFVFTAIVSQEEAARIFSDPIRQVRVRVAGEAGTTLVSPQWHILPGDQRRLPTAALGWQGGGGIAVEQDDREATTTTEPFFEVAADLPATAGVTLRHLRGGQAKFSMEPRPLALQWWRSLRQLFQKRYQL
jgi:putative peptide zinc metalloprotease protein